MWGYLEAREAGAGHALHPHGPRRPAPHTSLTPVAPPAIEIWRCSRAISSHHIQPPTSHLPYPATYRQVAPPAPRKTPSPHWPKPAHITARNPRTAGHNMLWSPPCPHPSPAPAIACPALTQPPAAAAPRLQGRWPRYRSGGGYRRAYAPTAASDRYSLSALYRRRLPPRVRYQRATQSGQ